MWFYRRNRWAFQIWQLNLGTLIVVDFGYGLVVGGFLNKIDLLNGYIDIKPFTGRFDPLTRKLDLTLPLHPGVVTLQIGKIRRLKQKNVGGRFPPPAMAA